MYIALPETSAATILLRRARRLRETTGNTNLKAQSELDQAHISARDVLFNALIKPVRLINLLSNAFPCR
jgi:DHA1 family multidrug resistance protein-like MFS transporter